MLDAFAKLFGDGNPWVGQHAASRRCAAILVAKLLGDAEHTCSNAKYASAPKRCSQSSDKRSWIDEARWPVEVTCKDLVANNPDVGSSPMAAEYRSAAFRQQSRLPATRRARRSRRWRSSPAG